MEHEIGGKPLDVPFDRLIQFTYRNPDRSTDPSRAVDARYLGYVAATREGRVLTGVLAQEDNENLTKKERLRLEREKEKLEKNLTGIKEMDERPDALFVIDVGYQKIAVTEATKLSIPIVGVVDTNHSPEGIAYVIPGNDDSSRAIRLYARGVADAILECKSQVIQEILQTEEFVEVSGDEAATLR